MTTTAVDQFHIGLVERLLRGTLVAAAVCAAAALWVGPSASLGVAAGAAASLLLISVYRPLSAVAARRRRLGLLALWAIWAAKWPVLGVPVYFGLKSGLIAGSWLCLGVGLLPAVAVLLALQAVATDAVASIGQRSVRLQ
ncbi:MAG: hypothetical protein ACE149_12450 [Armatimonadota bacterium]